MNAGQLLVIVAVVGIGGSIISYPMTGFLGLFAGVYAVYWFMKLMGEVERSGRPRRR